VTVPAHSTVSIPAGVQDNGEPAGSYLIGLLISSSIVGPDFNGDGLVASYALPQF